MDARTEQEIVAIYNNLTHGLPISVDDQRWLWNLMVAHVEPITVEHEEWIIATQLGPIEQRKKRCLYCDGGGCCYCGQSGYQTPE